MRWSPVSFILAQKQVGVPLDSVTCPECVKAEAGDLFCEGAVDWKILEDATEQPE